MIPESPIIRKAIGEPAILEQVAEECSELAQVALKLARVKREENPTPASWTALVIDFWHEFCDVCLCAEVSGLLPGWQQRERYKASKLQRWIQRLHDCKKVSDQACALYGPPKPILEGWDEDG